MKTSARAFGGLISLEYGLLGAEMFTGAAEKFQTAFAILRCRTRYGHMPKRETTGTGS
jgi:hypothetical protein